MQACFELMATNGSSKLSIDAFCRALSLLKIELSDSTVKRQLKAFVSGGNSRWRVCHSASPPLYLSQVFQ